MSGAVYWWIPPQLPHSATAIVLSLLWAFLALTAIWVDLLENWAHRLSSFAGFLFCTIEGMLGLLGYGEKGGLLLMACLHGTTFLLAVAGKFHSQARRRPRPSFEEIAKATLEDAQKP